MLFVRVLQLKVVVRKSLLVCGFGSGAKAAPIELSERVGGRVVVQHYVERTRSTLYWVFQHEIGAEKTVLGIP